MLIYLPKNCQNLSKKLFQDSEPDSPPSPAERDNAYTSDSDSSSSDSVSSSSASEKSINLKLPNKDSNDSKNTSTTKKPMIEELN